MHVCSSLWTTSPPSLSRKRLSKKHFANNGLLNLFLIDPETSLLENMMAVALHKRYGDNLYYYNKNVEVDFYIPDEDML